MVWIVFLSLRIEDYQLMSPIRLCPCLVEVNDIISISYVSCKSSDVYLLVIIFSDYNDFVMHKAAKYKMAVINSEGY